MFSARDRFHGNNRRQTGGYSLIEVMVAMAIFSAMLLLGVMAFNQGLQQYQGLADKGLRFWDFSRNIWMDKGFHSILDYYVHTDNEGWFPYFRGDQEGISFVTLAPFAGDLPVAAWIRKENMENGRQRLVYYELPVFAKSYRDLSIDFMSGAYRKGPSVTILEGADRIQFAYYGYDGRDRKHGWRLNFFGFQTRQIPLLVRIECRQDGEDRLFMYALHVNSQVKRGYESYYGP